MPLTTADIVDDATMLPGSEAQSVLQRLSGWIILLLLSPFLACGI